MFTIKDLEQMKPIGMNCTVSRRETLEGGETESIIVNLKHPRIDKNISIGFCLPVFTGSVIKWRNSFKALVHVADVFIDSDFEISLDEREQNNRMELIVKTPSVIIVKAIEEAIASSIRSWFYNAEDYIDFTSVQTSIDKWFSSGIEWRVLKQGNIAKQDQENTIIISPETIRLSHKERMINKVFNPELHGFVDLNSTSVGNNINSSFRLSDGAKYENNTVVKSKNDNPFCKILTNHAIGLQMNPKRAYLLRTTFEASVSLLNTEDPIVTPYAKDEEVKLHGLNLTTAVMHLDEFTHEDSIAISQSAANRMTALREITQLVESHLPVTPLAKVGDEVFTNTPIALDGEKHVLATKLYYPGIVDEISSSIGNRFGEKSHRSWFKMTCCYPLETGDKISNRHGGKGIVVVIPDEKMPQDAHGERVDICIGPESITNRKAMAILWEMMLTKEADATCVTNIKVNLFDEFSDKLVWSSGPKYDFEGLSKRYGDKIQLYIKGNKLPEETFVGKLFWIRLDKFAKEIVSSVNTQKTKNNIKGIVDQASLSGQRCNPPKLLAMCKRGLQDVALDIIENNMSAKEHFTNIINAIKNEENIDVF